MVLGETGAHLRAVVTSDRSGKVLWMFVQIVDFLKQAGDGLLMQTSGRCSRLHFMCDDVGTSAHHRGGGRCCQLNPHDGPLCLCLYSSAVLSHVTERGHLQQFVVEPAGLILDY